MPVVRKPIADPLIDVAKGHLPGGRAGDGRRDEVGVAERRLGVDTSRRIRGPTVGLHPGRRRVPASDETKSKSTSLDVESAQPVHVRQTAVQRVDGTVRVVQHVHVQLLTVI